MSNITPETAQQLAAQVPGEIANSQPTPVHASHALKHALPEDPQGHGHKRYRAEPHHTVLLTNDKKAEPVLSASQYVSDFLKTTTALSIIPREELGKISVLNASHVVPEALSMLTKNEILSAPVFDKQLDAYVGFVDYLDLSSLIVDIIRALMKETYPDTDTASLRAEEKTKLVHDAKEVFTGKKIFDITDLSKNNPYMPIRRGATLYQAIEILAKYGIHRIPIIDDEQKINAIFSQSAVVKFLFSNLDKFATKAKKSVAEMLSNREALTVLTIPETALAFEAFELMLTHRVSAVGVVNENGILSGVISATDLRIIGAHAGYLSHMFESVKDFLTKAREQNTELLVPVVKVTLEDTLGIVIESMEDNQVHRVFVVDQDEKPIYVFSMKDVLNEFIIGDGNNNVNASDT